MLQGRIMPGSVRLLNLSALAPLCLMVTALSAEAQQASAPKTSPVMTQVFTCSTQKPEPVAVAAAVAPLPVPPPQEAVKPAAYESNKGFPRWSDFPPPPKDVPDEAEFGRRVATLGVMRDQFSVSLNGLQWDVSSPDAIQAEGMARMNPAYLVPIETMTCEEYAEFVRLKQKLATPPPIADN